jgi:hypothetical protein
MDVDDDLPPDSCLQPSDDRHVSAAMMTTPIHRLLMNLKRVKAQELLGAQQHEHSKIPDSCKEWSFNGRVATLNPCRVEWDHDNDPVPYEIRQAFREIWEALRASFPKNAPDEIEYIVIVSYIEDFGSHWHDNEQMLKMPVRG